MSSLTHGRLPASDKSVAVSPGRSQKLIAAGCLILVAAAWFAHGVIVAAPKTLHFDILEAYAWGKEFQLGYDKHGPFWAWIAGAWFLLFPTTNASFVLLETLNAAIGGIGAWRLNGLFVKGWMRHASTLLLLITPFYTLMAYRYNASTIFVSLWPWALFYFVKSLDGMKMRDAAWFGIFAAAAMLSKYYAVILLLTCALSLAVHPNGRKYILSPLPFAAGASFLALFLPHLIWVLQNGAPTVTHAIAVTGQGWLFALRSAGRFMLETGAGLVLPALVIFITSRTSKAPPASEEGDRLSKSRRQFLSVLVLAPWILTVLFGLAFRLGLVPADGAGIFPLAPLFLIQFAAPLDGWRCFRFAGMAAIAASLIAVISAPIERDVLIKRAGPSVALPYRELAAQVTALWHSETGTPLHNAGGRLAYAYAMSFYSPDHPSSFTELNLNMAPWMTPARLKQYGLLIACAHDDGGCSGAALSFASGNWKQLPLSIARKAGSRQMPEVKYDIFIIPPQK
ncbi:MAG: glycosyltransferase family 39 protein [Rhodomicrobium sp.]